MPELGSILIAVLVILAVLLVLTLIFRLLKAAIVIALLVVLVPILCTIMWGDGSDYVSKFASLFTSDIETGINEGYEAYRDENAKNPVVDLEQVEQYFDDASQWVGDKFSQPVFPEK